MNKDVTNLAEINSLLTDMNDGGLYSYDEPDQALIFQLQSNGGPQENETLYIKFDYVEYFHLPISLSVTVSGSPIDEVAIVPENELISIMPNNIDGNISYKGSDYRCFRLIADGVPTSFYIYCLKVKAWVEPYTQA